MSVKPIDKQLMYQNSMHEAKNKQNQQNKPMNTHHMLENEEAKRLKREESRIQKGEGTKGQKIKRENRDARKDSRKDQEKSKKNRKDKGNKLDIRI